MSNEKNFKNLVEKIEEIKKGKTYDLSLEEDLSIAVMNLISLEEHFFFTGVKTDKPEYFQLLDETRAIRTELLAKMIDRHEGETWCVSKHLLATTMRLIEVGTKYYSNGKKTEARAVFANASKVYSLFWGLRLKLVSTAGIKKIDDDQINKKDGGADQPLSAQAGWETEDILKKLVNCCKE